LEILPSCESEKNSIRQLQRWAHKITAAYLQKVLAGSTGQGAVDLKALNQGGRGDQLHLGNLVLQSLPAVLIEQYLGIHLLPELSLAPLLLTNPRQTQYG
jgi:hypothetical protein